MSRDKNDRDPNTGEQTCGQPMEGHFSALLTIMAAAGASFDCREIYHALVEVAEVYKRVGGFNPYVATEIGVGAQTAPRLKEALALREAQANAQDGNVLDAEFTEADTIPDGPDVKRAYDALTKEQRKRFN